MMKRAIALLPALVALVAAAPQQQPADGVFWAKSWDDAKVEAKDRNVPIFITIQQDDNPGCKQMEGVFRDGGWIRESRRVVCVVTNPDIKHGAKEKTDGKMKTLLCRAYDGMSCEVHVGCQNAMEGFIKSGNFDIPMQIWCRPDGSELFRHTGPQGSGAQTAPELVRELERALDRVSGPKLSRQEWVVLRAMMREGEEAQAKLEFKKALTHFKKLSEVKYEKFAKQGKELLDNLVKSCLRLVSEAVKQYERSTGSDKKSADLRKEAKDMLVKISKEMKGTEAAEKAEEGLKKLK